MIPASYLYKDVFQHAWYDADKEAATERHKVSRPSGGHTIANLWGTLIAAIPSLGRGQGKPTHA